MNDASAFVASPVRPEPARLPPARPETAGGAATGLDPELGRALLESRQRWRDLVALSADLAFETDADGRFAFLMPDPVLGWPAAALLARDPDALLANGAGDFNPFRATRPLRGQRVWVRRADGGVSCLMFAVAPLLDPAGRPVGTRGLGIDITAQSAAEAQAAAALRRAEVIDHILRRMREEVLAPRMMRAALDAIRNALGAEGVAVLSLGPAGVVVQHQSGAGAGGVLGAIAAALDGPADQVSVSVAAEEARKLIVCGCRTRFGDKAGLAIWRAGPGRAWDAEDRLLAAGATSLVRVVLEHQAIQREMARQARTDALTGLLNRRAFLEELPRHIERLDREETPGTLIFADLDNFKAVNDQLGHEVGDRVLCRTAALLRRTVRPTDLVARLGGDEFALWLNGADHMTAAERAEALRIGAPDELGEVVGGPEPRLSLSIGIATRPPGSAEDIDSLMRRADLAMFEVKREGRGHWRVAPEVAP